MRHCDLFAGIGGFRLAAEEHGGRCVFSSEIDRWACETYAANFGDEPAGDIRNIEPAAIPDHDLLTAGFPCPAFSVAGVSKRRSMGRATGGEAEDGRLWREVLRVVEAKKPRAVLLENVPEFAKSVEAKHMTTRLERAGYMVNCEFYNSRHLTPQSRRRVFIAATLTPEFGRLMSFIPERGEIERGRQKRLKQILETTPEDKYALTEKTWKTLQRRKKESEEKGDGFGYTIANPEEPARTLTASYGKDSHAILIAQEGRRPRRLTPRECARLMGFPEDYKIPVSDTQAYRQFGNSVVVPLVSAIIADMRSRGAV